MNKFLFLFATVSFLLFSCSNNQLLVEFKTSQFLIGIGVNGNVDKLIDIQNQKDYVSTDTISPLLSCMVNSEMIYPIAASFENSILSIQFKGNLEAKIKVEEKQSHVKFEMIVCRNSIFLSRK